MRGSVEAGPRATAAQCGCVQPALETGNLLTEPIGYLESCFSAKNGTPRQPSICSLSRACLRIRKSIFNNPEHSLMGLEQFSHVWILFVFHKNGHLSCKAKVQPPRLNGAKTGVFSTRSPHRPNAIGLTLAKLDRVEGGAVYLSGVDMVHGTPVLDIKPYIADYDSPQSVMVPPADADSQDDKHEPTLESADQHQCPGSLGPQPELATKEGLKCPGNRTSEEYTSEHVDAATSGNVPKPGERAATVGLGPKSCPRSRGPEAHPGSGPLEASLSEEGTGKGPSRGQEAAGSLGSQVDSQPGPPPSLSRAAPEAPHSVVPTWVREAPVTTLEVRFTPHAELDLRHLSSDAGHPAFQYFQSAEEARRAMVAVLSADPRSVYRRKLCQDRLFYFTVDTAHVTCWFGDGFAEVLRIRHAAGPVHKPDPDPAEAPGSLGSSGGPAAGSR
ncbi:tRNA (adenine(37)-N6)-methyltransferase [Echinops telfairi]|uniref:tRNA (Adenine(37)-N6)-methyltransferase n=1 Tax=Echinops telfairi TaxID=9371 RepID=A0ABM0IYZ7_ECHTE|nr:tRNA (adenine(37)-N6)-methyltransferase [Echinops telfairi]